MSSGNSLWKPVCLALVWLLGGCASNEPRTPYPAFVQVDELPDVFIAGLPGVRAKQLVGNPATRRSSYRVLLPPDWSFTTGASPGMSVEIFVLAGEIGLGDLSLGAGGYAYIPDGWTGMQMKTNQGALLLYFLDDADPTAVIQTPMLLNSGLVGWTPLSDDPNDLGLSVRELRADPGSGARSWLMKIEPIANRDWQRSSITREGYLVAGSYRDSECINGEAVTSDYAPGGYFYRPPGAVSGGPGATTSVSATWFLRVLKKETLQALTDCVVVDAGR